MTNPDLVLLQTQRLTDNPNGGGQMTNTIVPDNQANNLFGPISRVNRADGNVSLRKAIIKALSADTKTYFGAHIIVASPPSNADVTAMIFSTGSWTDVRSEAVEFVQSYLVQGPQTRLWPYGQQVIGQRSIIAYQPITDALPNIGDTYVIFNQGVTPNVSQFVKIRSVSSVVQQFTDNQGTFELNVITMGITEPLTATYPGANAQRTSTPVPPCVMCTTNVANAATYYGVQTLAADATAGDEAAALTSIFGQLVPSSTGEAPITLATPTGASGSVASGPSVITFGTSGGAPAATTYARRGIMPGSFVAKNISGVVVAVDNGDGNVYLGTVPGGTVIGALDYETGKLSLTNTSFTSGGPVTYTALPAVKVQQAGFSSQQPVTEATRGYVYNATLDPIPAPGSTFVSYRALGRWYDLRDDGAGNLLGPVGAGAGSIRFDSGACTVSLGALPDIGSNVVFGWGQKAEYSVRTTDTDIAIPAMSFTLSNPAKPSTISITYVVSSVTKTVTDNGSGVLSGDGSGTVVYTGPGGGAIITLYPSALPAVNTGFAVAYQINPATTESFTPTLSGSNISITLNSGSPIAPKSVNISYLLLIPQTFPAIFGPVAQLEVQLHDNGSGGLIDQFGSAIVGASVNYTTGVVTFNPSISRNLAYTPAYKTAPSYQFVGGAWTTVQVPYVWFYQVDLQTIPFVNGTVVHATSTAASATNSAHTDNFPAPAIKLDLTPKTSETIVPGGVMFTFAGDVYVDRGGTLYRSVSFANNSGTAAGTIDYTTGLATITDWGAGGSQTLTMQALLCQYGSIPISTISSRVPGQSIRPSSFYIQANRKTDSALVSATADSDGDILTSDMRGHIDVATGFFTVSFGQLVLDSSLSPSQKTEPWYNSANIDGTGHIWFPNEALAGTVRYSCVVETILPLSAGVLGLDPVRLPSDGRVPIFQPGYTLVFRNPLTFTFGGSVVAGDVITLPRDQLESAVLYDQDGVQVDIGLYTADLDAGTVTMSTPCNLSAYTQPLVCTHTRGEMVLCEDAEIGGGITFTPGLVHSYPAASSFVSSALIAPNAGNLQADYDTLFAQTTWNFDPAHLWDDVVHGSAPTAAYDDVNHPIQVLDRDTITQRVALIFTSATTGNIAFEELGIIGTFNTSTNVAPVNPATGNPYFVLDHLGFGTGWANGNAIRFNLRGAGFPVWFARCVQVGAAATLEDGFATETRWDE
jgi:hypothetical protein